jgi:tRNA(fMet)-specific endonuclease VapC
MLDTNIISALMRQDSLWYRAEAYGPEDLCTSLVVAAELRFGAVRRKSARLKREVDEILARIAVLPLEPPVDLIYADIRSRLQEAGTPIGPNDLWIAAHAVALDFTLITANLGEFSRVPGLRVESWVD